MSDDLFEDKPVENLAKLKTFIEEQIEDLEIKISQLKKFLKAIDFFLVKSSLKTADEFTSSIEKEMGLKVIKDDNGVLLGEINIERNKIIFTTNPRMKISVKAPPLQSFFLPKVLEKYKKEDLQLVKENKIKQNEVFDYTVQEENSLVKKILINNYREQTRLKEIERTLKWSIQKALS